LIGSPLTLRAIRAPSNAGLSGRPQRGKPCHQGWPWAASAAALAQARSPSSPIPTACTDPTVIPLITTGTPLTGDVSGIATTGPGPFVNGSPPYCGPE